MPDNDATKIDSQTKESDLQVTFKLIKSMDLKGAERLDSRVTFQNGHRLTIGEKVDEAKPYCQILFNSEMVERQRGHLKPLTLVSHFSRGEKLVPIVEKGSGLVSVEISASKNQVLPDEDSFVIQCNLLTSKTYEVSQFSLEEVQTIIGPTLEFTRDDRNTAQLEKQQSAD